MTSYQNTPMVLPVPSGDEDQSDVYAVETTTRPFSKIGLAVLGSMALVYSVFVFGGPSSLSSLPESAVPMLGSKSAVADCTFKECYASNCNAKVAPYTCLFHNGGPHGGCSPTPWISGTCTKQCDLSACDSLDIAKDVPTCDTKCDKEWCASGRLCGSDVSYQCSVGSSAFGCSSDKYMWTLKTKSSSCSSCCNVNTCD
ncbi:expressed unknown protein [Seminavis robusta]|uniref:Uncharacterized protein n=1 Tax=Seminavis robusta TaxID=568900 RepID=A0A9N8H890_9STRA|nr:expressed unknown protein [Seminavis robusta]|eukprot:Sro162_g072860.1 n/a (199) ;mRNA; r:50585-51181